MSIDVFEIVLAAAVFTLIAATLLSLAVGALRRATPPAARTRPAKAAHSPFSFPRPHRPSRVSAFKLNPH